MNQKMSVKLKVEEELLGKQEELKKNRNHPVIKEEKHDVGND